MSFVISNHVSTDSLYGVKTFFLVSACSDKAEMTFPRVSRDLLIMAPSCKNTWGNLRNRKKKQNNTLTQIFDRKFYNGISRVYPESVSACLSRVGAFAARQVHQVNPAGDAVLVLLALHELSLFKSINKIQEYIQVNKNTTKIVMVLETVLQSFHSESVPASELKPG